MKLIATTRDQQNAAIFDPWSVVHLAVGLAAGLVGVSPGLGFRAAVAYEAVELYSESQSAGIARQIFLTRGPESLPNIAADLALFALGQQLGLHWRALPSNRRGRDRGPA